MKRFVPAGHPFRLPETLRGELNDDQFKLFELIWKRTIARPDERCQGTPYNHHH